MKSITLDKIITSVNLEIIKGSLKFASKIKIKNRGINNGGLELSGFMFEKDKDKMIIFGKKELEFVNSFSSEKLKETFMNLFKNQIATAVFIKDVEIPQEAIQAAKETNAVILKSHFGYTDTGFQIAEFLTQKLSTTDNIHGSFIQIYDKGIVIIGESGIGKSETTLELIKNGHLFIVDDALIVRRIGSQLFGESPKVIKNLIEVRGIGIMDITKIFGESSTIDTTQIDYIFHLKLFDKETNFDRLGENIEYKKILGIEIPIISIPVSAARNTSMLIEVAVINNIVQEKGYNALEVYRERIKNNVK